MQKHQPTPAAGICSRRDTPKPKQKGNREVDQLSHVDNVTTNTHSSQGEKLKITRVGETVAWSNSMEGHAQKCVDRYCEPANKKTEQLYKVSRPCMLTIPRKRNYDHKIVLKCWYVATIGRPDILWSVNNLARSVTKWTGACDRRLARLIAYIHRTSDYRQYCHVGITAQHCRSGLFQDSDIAGDLEHSKSNSRESYVSSVVEHSFFLDRCVRNKRHDLTVRLNQKSFRWMLDCEWMNYMLSIYGMW